MCSINWIIMHVFALKLLLLCLFSPRSMYFASVMCYLWGKYSEGETDDYKRPASITTYTHQHPRSPHLCVLLPSPRPLLGPDRQEWPCMTTNYRAENCSCDESTGFCSAKFKPHHSQTWTFQLRPSPFRRAPLNLNQLHLSLCPQTWPLTSYFTPCRLRNGSWKSA